MTTRRWWIVLIVLGFVAAIGLGRRPESLAQPAHPATGRYQIAAFPGKAPQFGMELQGTGCYLVDTATGELWSLTLDQQRNSIWKRIAGPVH